MRSISWKLGGALLLAGPKPRVKRLLDITGLDQILAVHGDVAAALKEELETSRAANPRPARAAQQRVAAVARQLAHEGGLTLKPAGENGEPGETGSEEDREQQASAPHEEADPEERPEAETRGEEG